MGFCLTSATRLKCQQCRDTAYHCGEWRNVIYQIPRRTLGTSSIQFERCMLNKQQKKSRQHFETPKRNLILHVLRRAFRLGMDS